MLVTSVVSMFGSVCPFGISLGVTPKFPSLARTFCPSVDRILLVMSGFGVLS